MKKQPNTLKRNNVIYSINPNSKVPSFNGVIVKNSDKIPVNLKVSNACKVILFKSSNEVRILARMTKLGSVGFKKS